MLIVMNHLIYVAKLIEIYSIYSKWIILLSESLMHTYLQTTPPQYIWLIHYEYIL